MPQLRKLNTGDKLKPQVRNLELRAASADRAIVDPDTRELQLTFSSEQPVERWWGDEVLSHDAGAADLSRLNDGAPLLFNHNMDDIIGVVEKASIGNDKRGHATVRFAKTARADEIISMIDDGILRNVSFMYDVDKFVASERDGDGDVEQYTATAWRVFEISIVSVPADQSIGIGRAAAVEEKSVQVERSVRAAHATTPAAAAATTPSNEEIMTEEEKKAAAAAAAAAVELTTARNEAVAEARKAELERVREIEAIGKKHGLKADQVAKFVQDGTSIAEVRGIVLDDMFKRGGGPVARFGNETLELSDGEKARYSMIRAINAAINNDWKNAGFEREVSDEIAKTNQRQSKAGTSFFVPMNLPFAPDAEHARAYRMQAGHGRAVRAPYLVGTAAQGGNLVESNLLAEDFIEVLRNQSVMSILGARMLTGLVGNVDIPRQNGQTSTYWVGESGALTESEATFDKVQLRPKTIGALSRMSRLMLLQSTPAIEMLARQDLLAVMALGMDLAALSGSGSSNQPTGIVNQSGVASVVGGTNGANLTFDNLIQMQYATKFANAPQGSAAYAMNSKTIGYLSTQKASTGQYLWDPQGGLTNASPDRVKGRAYAESQQLRYSLTKGTSTGTCSELIYGNWQELLIGSWGVMELMVNPYDSTGFANGDVLIRAMQTADVGVRHGASFAVMSDALTPGF